MKWLYGILCLIFLVIFHEFGHFIAAKIFGVKVESFSVGFGPVLFHKTIKGTDWRISLFPLGGYCGMKGEKDFQEAIDNDLLTVSGDSDSLYGIHPLKRALIGFAGPFFNFLFAVLACTLINLVGYKYSTFSNQIVVIEPTAEITYPAYKAGLKTGDKILSINGSKIEDYSDIVQKITINAEEDLHIIVERENKELSFTIHTLLNKEDGRGVLGIYPESSIIHSKESPHYNIFQAIGHGFLDTFKYIGITFKGIRVLFKGVKITNAISGPIRATHMMGTAIQDGFSTDFRSGFYEINTILAVISLSLFIMNLLPIPILDGGLILIAVIETIFRKKIRPKVLYYIQFIGLAFIAILFVLGLIGDITYFINRSK